MTTLPKAAIDAAMAAYTEIMARDGFIANEDIPAMFEAAILAALPHLGDPVAIIRYDRAHEPNEMPRVISCNLLEDGYYSVYLAPPAPAGKIKVLKWDKASNNIYYSNPTGYRIVINSKENISLFGFLGSFESKHSSLASAQSAADDDNKRRILSAIETVP